MTTNKPEIRAFLMQKDGHEPYVSIRRDSQCVSVIHPLIRLSDYQALQARAEEQARMLEFCGEKWRSSQAERERIRREEEDRAQREAKAIAEKERERIRAEEQQPDITHDQILAITTAYEAGVGKGHDAYRRGVEIPNPWSPSWGCDQAWDMGYQEGKEQAARKEGAEQQPAPDVTPWEELDYSKMTRKQMAVYSGQQNFTVTALRKRIERMEVKVRNQQEALRQMSSATDVSDLVEALESLMGKYPASRHLQDTCTAALAAHRKGAQP